MQELTEVNDILDCLDLEIEGYLEQITQMMQKGTHRHPANYPMFCEYSGAKLALEMLRRRIRPSPIQSSTE